MNDVLPVESQAENYCLAKLADWSQGSLYHYPLYFLIALIDSKYLKV